MGPKLPSTIAIDGPAASGKNTVGMLLAHQLGCPFIDSGAMYRAVTLRAIADGIDPEDVQALPELARGLTFTFVPPSSSAPSGRIVVNGEDVTEALHTPAVDAKVSLVSRIPAVREILVAEQRRLAACGPVVMVGRDIGTVVLPDADLKVYLDASPGERARRREHELHEHGQAVDFQQVLSEIERRDRLDRERTVSPLRAAADALIVSTDGLTPEQVAAAILGRFAEHAAL